MPPLAGICWRGKIALADGAEKRELTLSKPLSASVAPRMYSVVRSNTFSLSGNVLQIFHMMSRTISRRYGFVRLRAWHAGASVWRHFVSNDVTKPMLAAPEMREFLGPLSAISGGIESFAFAKLIAGEIKLPA